MRFIFFFCLVFSTSIVCGQTLVPSDLKLTIVGRDLKDSILTVQELLTIEKIEGNFSWLQVNEVTVVAAGICMNTQGVNSVTCHGNVICKKGKELLRRCRPGSIVFIESNNTTNRSGLKLPVYSIMIKIK